MHKVDIHFFTLLINSIEILSIFCLYTILILTQIRSFIKFNRLNLGTLRIMKRFWMTCLAVGVACSIFVTSVTSDIVINEIHYDPDDKTEWVEFIELYNNGYTAVDLSNWYFKSGIDYTFPAQTILASDGYLVIAQDIAAVKTKYNLSGSTVLGPFAGRLDNDGEIVELCMSDGQTADRVDYSLGFPWPTVGNPVPDNTSGTSHSIQLIHPSLENDISGAWRSASPTPTRRNKVFSTQVPPQIRQVSHDPEQPSSNQTVLLAAKISDPDGVGLVRLFYQIVDPGKYIALDDPQYQTSWQEAFMVDDGTGGDKIAGDFVYTYQIPSDIQRHRRLVRYKISVSDTLGNSVTVPYADDPQPNFAYFVYDGVPFWTGAVRPGSTFPVTYSSELLNSIPVYHLISSKEKVEKCTWLDQDPGNEYPYIGTLVYDGIVYDHIRFRARGGVWRYAMGKNMWKFNMNRGHRFQARDNYGRKYKTKWDKVNLGANIQQGDYLHRGEQGMFESVGFKLFNLAGQESSNTNFVHFRIIDEEHEDGLLNAAHPPLTTGGTQYDGDFWGLYLATEQVDGRFLDEHGLPDGNLYKMENGTGEIRNQSPYGVKDKSDLRSFMGGYQRRPAADWWRENIHTGRYYNYRSIVEGIHHYDIAYGKNYYYYLNPETNQWFHIPWDLDLTWANNMFGNGEDPFKQAGILSHSELQIEYQNRMCEIRDLLYNPDQTGQLIDEIASFIYSPGQPSFVDADRAMWDYHWVMSDQAMYQGYRDNITKSGQGRFYQIAPTKDFAGMLKLMKDYVVSRGDWIDRTVLGRNQNIPHTPVISPVNDRFRVDSLVFKTTEFSDPDNEDTFAAIKWRIAEVEPFSIPWDPSVPPDTTIPGATILIQKSSVWTYFKGTREPSAPRAAWRMLDFDDSSWLSGEAPVGYGEQFIATRLGDMRGGYTTFYMRKQFTVDNLDSIDRLLVNVLFDDGFNLWINGVHVAKDHVDSEELPFNALAVHRENTNYVAYELPDPRQYLKHGTNLVAIQVINQFLDQSSDCFMDIELIAYEKTGEEPQPEKPIRDKTSPMRYEIDAVWESEEIAEFQPQYAIPSTNIVPGRVYRVRAKMKDSAGRWSHWSMPVQFTAEPSDMTRLVRDHLRITELMYNPSAGNPFEFIELRNTHPSSHLDLGGIAFTEGVSFAIPPGTLLEPDGYLILADVRSEKDMQAFRSAYAIDDSVPILGPLEGRLANEGETITLKSSIDGEVLISFTYNDGRGWPLAADGAGHSLVPLASAIDSQPDGSLDYGANWRQSAFINGSPGAADPEPSRHIVLNELMANASDGNDWIELFNTSENTVRLDFWYLSDSDDNLKKWALPPIEMAPGQRVSFDSNTGFNVSGNGFGLNKNGEQVFLSFLPGIAGVDRVIDCVSFKAQDPHGSWGRYRNSIDFWSTMPPTRNDMNADVRSSVVIDELMYHPQDSSDPASSLVSFEYIELYNVTGQTIPLWNSFGPWRLDGGVDFILPPTIAIPPQGRLLLVPFHPDDSASLSAFMAKYSLEGQPESNGHVVQLNNVKSNSLQLRTGLTNSVQLIGPYTGNLSNQGERIAVEQLLDVDPADGSLAWSIVDEVIYFHQTPWPAEAGGSGKSLQRVSPDLSGNDPRNWTAAPPTPGAESGIPTFIEGWMMY